MAAVKLLAQDKMPNVDHQTSQLPKFWSAQTGFGLAKMIQINNRFLFWLKEFGQLAILPNGLKNVFMFFYLQIFTKDCQIFLLGSSNVTKNVKDALNFFLLSYPSIAKFGEIVLWMTTTSSLID
jgi:hypothetical protein